MTEYIDDFNKKTIWVLSDINDRVHITIRKEVKVMHEALSLDAAEELFQQLGNIINLIEEKK